MSSKHEKTSKLPKEVERIRTHVAVGLKAPEHTSSIDAADAFKALKVDNSLVLDEFRKNLKIQIVQMNEEEIQFDIIGIDAPIANAFRRILLSEVPSMAIEKVRIFQNTSVIQDEVLAHRLGLIPIKADPRLFKYVEEGKGVPNENNTLVFTLDVACTRNTKAPASAPESEKYINDVVYSKDMQWVPQGKQAERFQASPIKTVNDDIIVAKMRPGQSMEIEMHVVKGIGQTHAKWSPVATASYRLMPQIDLLQDLRGEEAQALVAKCPMGVFDIEDTGRAQVANPRNCTMCRECIREPGWEEKVQLSRVRDHFLFSVESTGVYRPQDLFRECIKVLASKCDTVLKELS